ncbi:DSC E3 ubiquitin ligase complex subunit 2 [Rhypophila sp. PSN 637]
MSFSNAPVTRTLVLGLAGASIAATLLDIKHYFYISVTTHFLRYHQPWRALIYQLCYTNSSEVLFACMSLYNLRTIEQLWGSRKYASFIIVTYLLTSVITPLLLTLVLRPLSMGVVDFLPAGPTPIIFGVLAQYHAIVPHLYKYKLALSTGAPTADESQTPGLTFSDKSTRYVMALQLALFQWPGSLLGAVVGWAVGYLWRNELLPGVLTRWRVPGWMIGVKTHGPRQGIEGIRRRLEDEGSSMSTASGAQPVAGGQGDTNRRRTMGEQILDEVRGAL